MRLPLAALVATGLFLASPYSFARRVRPCSDPISSTGKVRAVIYRSEDLGIGVELLDYPKEHFPREQDVEDLKKHIEQAHSHLRYVPGDYRVFFESSVTGIGEPVPVNIEVEILVDDGRWSSRIINQNDIPKGTEQAIQRTANLLVSAVSGTFSYMAGWLGPGQRVFARVILKASPPRW